MAKAGVLVVDDSAFMRKVLTQIISSAAEFEVVATARNGREALAALERLGTAVELITLDIQMPEMDGLSCLKQIMQHSPRRVVMVSSLTTEGASETLQALECGAIDFIGKPGGAISLNFDSVAVELLTILRGALRARIPTVDKPAPTRSLAPAVAPPVHATYASLPRNKAPLIAIACSTGGPKALSALIPRLPGDLPAAVLVVQHMPAKFTQLLADRLNQVSALQVSEARDGDKLEPGRCLIAPGGRHTEITPQETVLLSDGPPIGGLRPCADFTFATLAPVFGARTVGVVLTGMGRDGTAGCSELKRRGARIIAESKASALIWGMPRSIVEAGLDDACVTIDAMAQTLVETLQADP